MLSKLLTTEVKIALSLVLAILVIVWVSKLERDAYTSGYNKAIEEFAEKALVQLQEKETKRAQAEKELLQVNVALETEKAKKKQVIKEVTRDVIQYVQVPDRAQCKFDADWLRIRESAIFIADPRSPPTR